MNEVIMLREAEPRRILRTLIVEQVPASMSYLSREKWRTMKVWLIDLGADILETEILPMEKRRPINIQFGQSVGISLKYGFGKFIFETKVLSLEPSAAPEDGGIIVLAMPREIELVQRRSYSRVQVPRTLEVNVIVWHRHQTDGDSWKSPERYWDGRLVDISAGGVQIAFDVAQRPNFREGQSVGLRFTPMLYETPLMFNAQVRNNFTASNDNSVYIGLQMIGLEASAEGRLVLQRICNVVEQYHHMNQSCAREQDMQPVCL